MPDGIHMEKYRPKFHFSAEKYIINDPNSYTRTLKKWSYDELKTEIVAMWEFSK